MTVSLTICSSVGWASAADMSGKASYTVGYMYSGSYQLHSYGYTVSYSSMSTQSVNFTWYDSGNTPVAFGSLDLDDDGLYYTGAVGVYYSYYYGMDFQSLVSRPGSPSTRWKNHLGNDGSGEHDVKIVTFTPAGYTPGSGASYGYSLSAQYLGSEDAPITDLRILGDASCVVGTLVASPGNMFYFVVPSFRVVATETSADLEALEGIADAIAAQSDILQAMYGDLIAICNSIYQRTGDILQAQQLTNEYFSQVIPLLNSLKNTTADIYTLLQAQFNLLISTIETASTDIQGAISAQTAALIAYLDSVFQAGVNPDTAQRTDDIETGLGSLNDGESTYTSAATERYEALTANFSGFEGDTLSGVALASNLFKQIWDTFGSYNIVYTFPLTFGLSLVFLGRLSRFHQHEVIRDSRRSRGDGGKGKGKDG